MTDFSFTSSTISDTTQKKIAIDFLPEWAQQTEQIQKFFDGAIQQWFTPESNEAINGYIGTKGSADKSKLFIDEQDPLRNEYQLSPAYVSKSDSNTILGNLHYQDLIDNLKNEGALTDNESRLLQGSFYSWAPPINPDMFVNYSNYYWDTENESSINTPYYIVMERGSIDGNLWSAFNYWYYISNTDVTIDSINSGRFVQATRPIIQFVKNIELYDFGRYARTPVDLVSETVVPQDIMFRNLSDNIKIDDEYIKAGDRILFTSISTNKGENNRVYVVTTETINSVDVYGLYLDPTEFSSTRPTGEPVQYDTIRVKRGTTYKNKILWWNGSNWASGQQKTSINQNINFNLYNSSYTALDDTSEYPNSTFAGNTVFTYYNGSTYTYDNTLNRNVTYDTDGNILYYNAMQAETYYYNTSSIIEDVRFYKVLGATQVSDAYYTDWRKASSPLQQYMTTSTAAKYSTDDSQITTFTYDYSLPVVPSSTKYNAVKVSVDGSNLNYNNTATNFSDLDTNEFYYSNNVAHINYDLSTNSYVKISAIGDTILDSNAVYEIPYNLSNNANNESISIINSSVLIYHFMSIISNQDGITGSPYGVNNFNNTVRDISKGTEIVQHGSSLLPLMAHYTAKQLNIVDSINYSKVNYNQYRNKFIQLMNTLVSTDTSSDTVLCQEILSQITLSKTSEFPFWLSSMADSLIDNSYMPCTPAYLGITDVHVPKTLVQLDLNGTGTSLYNINHMGQLSKAYSTLNSGTIIQDRRDNILYILEMSIYNSINTSYRQYDRILPYSVYDIKPNLFRNTNFSKDEYKNLVLRSFKQWAYDNSVDVYTNNDFVQENWKTYNYSSCTYHIDNSPVSGSWRAIYLDYFDTTTPHTTPWAMLGFSIKPTWWDTVYSDFIVVGTQNVYTSASMWADIETGTIRQGNRAGIDSRFARPGISTYIPYDFITGTLYAPWTAPAGMNPLINAKPSYANAAVDWKIGDIGSIEYSYMQSTFYKFEECIGLYLAQPAKFCSYFWDTANYSVTKVNGVTEFINTTTKKRLAFNSNMSVHGEDDVAVYGYQTWVSDYLKSQHYDITTSYGRLIRGSKPQLMHRIGGFSTETALTFSSDSFGLIPSENATVKLIKSAPRSQASYSAIRIDKTNGLYKVSGFNNKDNYFTYCTPLKSGIKYSNIINNVTVTDYKEFKGTSIIDYDTTFTSIQDVYQFIIGYGNYLVQNGWIFEDLDSSTGTVFDWHAIGDLFLEWVSGKPQDGTYITLTPSAKAVKFGSTFGFIDNVGTYNGGLWSIIDENYNSISTAEIDIVRLGNVIVLRVLDAVDKKLMSVRLNVVEFEHAVIFDNTTIFNNTIYLPIYGLYQRRMKINGTITSSWNGRLEAPGYMIVDNTTMPNFEKLVNDFIHYYDSENPQVSLNVSDLSKHLIGYQTRDFLVNLISTEANRFSFYKGYIREKGTKQAFDKVLRVVASTENTQDYKVFEEWAIKVGEYGNIKNTKALEFNIKQSDIKQDPQLVTYDESLTSDSATDNVITYFGSKGVDDRWITRPSGSMSFPVIQRNTHFIDIPSFGPINVNEISFITEDFSSINTDRLSYVKKNGSVPTSVWMLNNNGSWELFDIVDTGLLVTSVVVDGANNISTITVTGAINIANDTAIFINDPSSTTSNINIDTFWYYNSDNPNNQITYSGVLSELTYTSNYPKLYKYVNRFSTSDAKAQFVSSRNSYVPNNTHFIKPVVYNKGTDLTETYLNVWDPLQGMIPGSAASEITFISQNDPALYNNEDSNATAWGASHVGEVWWDTSTARYLDYTETTVLSDSDRDEYIRKQWGATLPGSSIDVYEWVKSPVQPSEWDNYVNSQDSTNKSSSTYLPSGTANQEYWSSIQEYDYSIADYKTYYYFWVKDSIYVPEVSTRYKSISEIANVIKDPTALNIPWFAAINSNKFIVSGLVDLIDENTSVLQLKYKVKDTEGVKHSQWLLMKEKDTYEVDSTLWDNMVNSLCASDESGNLLKYPSTDLGNTNSTVWFKDVLSARKILVQSINKILGSTSILSDTYYSSNILNYSSLYVNPYSFETSVVTYNSTYMLKISNPTYFSENDAIVLSTTGTLPTPLNANQTYYLHIVDSIQGIFRLKATNNSKAYFNITSKGAGQLYCTKTNDINTSDSDLSYKMTDYWGTSDWYSNGYSSNTPYIEYYDLTSVRMKDHVIGDVIRITDQSTSSWELYTLTYSRGALVWSSIGKSASTVQFNSKLYSGYSVLDNSGNVTNIEFRTRKIIRLLLSSLTSYGSLIFFDLMKYVHSEQSIVAWANKTSYISITGISQTLTSSTLSNSDTFSDALTYFTEVKPYRTKIRQLITQRTSDSDTANVSAIDSDPNSTYQTALSSMNYDGTAQNFNTIERSFRQQLDILNFDIVSNNINSNLNNESYYLSTYYDYFKQDYQDNSNLATLVVSNAGSSIFNGTYTEVLENIPSFSSFRNILAAKIAVDENKTVYKNSNNCFIWYLYNYGWVMSTVDSSVVYYVDYYASTVENSEIEDVQTWAQNISSTLVKNNIGISNITARTIKNTKTFNTNPFSNNTNWLKDQIQTQLIQEMNLLLPYDSTSIIKDNANSIFKSLTSDGYYFDVKAVKTLFNTLDETILSSAIANAMSSQAEIIEYFNNAANRIVMNNNSISRDELNYDLGIGFKGVHLSNNSNYRVSPGFSSSLDESILNFDVDYGIYLKNGTIQVGSPKGSLDVDYLQDDYFEFSGYGLFTWDLNTNTDNTTNIGSLNDNAYYAQNEQLNDPMGLTSGYIDDLAAYDQSGFEDATTEMIFESVSSSNCYTSDTSALAVNSGIFTNMYDITSLLHNNQFSTIKATISRLSPDMLADVDYGIYHGTGVTTDTYGILNEDFKLHTDFVGTNDDDIEIDLNQSFADSYNVNVGDFSVECDVMQHPKNKNVAIVSLPRKLSYLYSNWISNTAITESDYNLYHKRSKFPFVIDYEYFNQSSTILRIQDHQFVDNDTAMICYNLSNSTSYNDIAWVNIRVIDKNYITFDIDSNDNVITSPNYGIPEESKNKIKVQGTIFRVNKIPQGCDIKFNVMNYETMFDRNVSGGSLEYTYNNSSINTYDFVGFDNREPFKLNDNTVEYISNKPSVDSMFDNASATDSAVTFTLGN